ncbi:hypothetical protein G3480_25640 [Thiorhodococcus mannitoliphagus]|uniref:Uncharacterized protein n=2 Tax=Thiorhodococcus mannitoliphagus TaxID=329406 RepID=A0A6P1DZ75_9GAMM|nr:hypothetical protein [Thiorhodococcus mannitoliphagus]
MRAMAPRMASPTGIPVLLRPPIEDRERRHTPAASRMERGFGGQTLKEACVMCRGI